MSWTYSCPWCGAMLNPDSTIVLMAARGDKRLLIGFHPEPGNYEIYLPPDATLKEGEHWDFFCPVCHENLVNGEINSLCELRMTADGKDQRVFFSRIAGEHATFLLSGRQVEAKLGPDVKTYDPQIMPVRF